MHICFTLLISLLSFNYLHGAHLTEQDPLTLCSVNAELPYLPNELWSNIIEMSLEYKDKFTGHLTEIYTTRQVNKNWCALLGKIVSCLARARTQEIEEEVIKLNHIYQNSGVKIRLKNQINTRLWSNPCSKNYKWIQMFLENQVDIGIKKYSVYKNVTILDIVLARGENFIFKDLLLEHFCTITWTPEIIRNIKFKINLAEWAERLDLQNRAYSKEQPSADTTKIELYKNFYIALQNKLTTTNLLPKN